MTTKRMREVSTKAFAYVDNLEKSGKTGTDLATEIGVSRSLITQARIVRDYGTPEEKRLAASGDTGLRTLADAIKLRLPAEEREKLRRRQGTITSDYRKVIETDVDLWARLNPILHNLISLPRAEDMIAIVTRNNSREKVVDYLIDSAANWMEEFHNAWATRRHTKSGGHTPDSGGSNEASGVQQSEPTTE